MDAMPVGLLKIHIQLPGCTSLKEKRHRLKPLIVRLHKEFNVSVAEYERQDAWQEAVIAVALVSNERNQIQRSMQNIHVWIEKYWPDIYVLDNHLEIL
jgi:uncharacterized protein YlxP (DUF503 family)